MTFFTFVVAVVVVDVVVVDVRVFGVVAFIVFLNNNT